MTRWEQINNRLEPLRRQLLRHPLYDSLHDLPALQTFLEHHVFAVWDFMSLLKALQRSICCVGVPWVPPHDTHAVRLINEIVLAEESDELAPGRVASHFELYLDAMQSAGADIGPVEEFVDGLRSGLTVADALREVELPDAARRFVTETFRIIATGDVPAIAAAFTFGREDLLPGLFQEIVKRLNDESDGVLTPFVEYLDRHIELDGDTHGPLARRLVESLCGEDAAAWQSADAAAEQALQSRLRFWDAIWKAIREPEDNAFLSAR